MAHPSRSVGVTARRVPRVAARAVARSPGRPALAAIGDIVFEVVATAERDLEVGSDVPGTVRIRRGGSAANVSAAFARLGGRSVFIGAVGKDRAGRDVLDALGSAGVEPRVTRVDAPTARLLALIGRDGERSFVTQRGAADLPPPADLSVRWLSGIGAVHVPGYSLYNEPLGSAAIRAIELGRARGAL